MPERVRHVEPDRPTLSQIASNSLTPFPLLLPLRPFSSPSPRRPPALLPILDVGPDLPP